MSHGLKQTNLLHNKKLLWYYTRDLKGQKAKKQNKKEEQEKKKHIFSHLPLVISIHTETFGFICSGLRDLSLRFLPPLQRSSERFWKNEKEASFQKQCYAVTLDNHQQTSVWTVFNFLKRKGSPKEKCWHYGLFYYLLLSSMIRALFLFFSYIFFQCCEHQKHNFIHLHCIWKEAEITKTWTY